MYLVVFVGAYLVCVFYLNDSIDDPFHFPSLREEVGFLTIFTFNFFNTIFYKFFKMILNIRFEMSRGDGYTYGKLVR